MWPSITDRSAGYWGLLFTRTFRTTPSVYLYYTESSTAERYCGPPDPPWRTASIATRGMAALWSIPASSRRSGDARAEPRWRNHYLRPRWQAVRRDRRPQPQWSAAKPPDRCGPRRHVGDLAAQRRRHHSRRQSVPRSRRKPGQVLRLWHPEFLRARLRSGDQQALDDGKRPE